MTAVVEDNYELGNRQQAIKAGMEAIEFIQMTMYGGYSDTSTPINTLRKKLLECAVRWTDREVDGIVDRDIPRLHGEDVPN